MLLDFNLINQTFGTTNRGYYKSYPQMPGMQKRKDARDPGDSPYSFTGQAPANHVVFIVTVKSHL